MPDLKKLITLEALQAALPSWLKSSSKPSYTADEISDTNTTNKFVTSADKSTWNAKGTYSKPTGGIPKSDLSQLVQNSLDLADSALQSESDPTVPSWAKQTNKPSYTQDEVTDGTTYKRVTQTEKDTWSGKQNALTTTQMNAVNSGITASIVSAVYKKETTLSNYTDLNTLKTFDKIWISPSGSSSQTMVNTPWTIGGMRIYNEPIVSTASSASLFYQYVIPNTPRGDILFRRRYASNGWEDWYSCSGVTHYDNDQSASLNSFSDGKVTFWSSSAIGKVPGNQWVSVQTDYFKTDGTRKRQILMGGSDGKTMFRYYNGSSWSAWDETPSGTNHYKADTTTTIGADWTLTSIVLQAPVDAIVSMTATAIWGAKAPRGIRITRSNTSASTNVIATIEVSEDKVQISTSGFGTKLNGVNTYYVWAKAKESGTMPVYLTYSYPIKD